MRSYKELYKAAKDRKTIKQLTPQYIRWDKEGQQVIGAYMSQNKVQSRLGGTEYNQYIFETDDGLVKFALGRAADSEFALMFGAGIVYAITYKGKEKISGGRQVNRFEVEELGVAELVDELDLDPTKDDSTKHKK